MFKKINYSFFISFLFLSCFCFLFSGCSEEIDCSTQNTVYNTYSYDEESEKCVLISSINKNKCGNGVAEKGEDACNCPSDVSELLSLDEGGCSGMKGDYLEYFCNEKTEVCDLQVTDKVKQNSKLITLKQGSDFSIDTKVNYYIPFMTDRHTLDIEFLLKDIMDTDSYKMKDLTIKKVYIVTTTKELLGDKSVNLKFEKQYDEFKVSVPIDAFTFDTFDKEMRNVNVKLLVDYTKETYQKSSSGIYELFKSEDKSVEIYDTFESKLQLINPQNKAENLEEHSGGWS